MSKTHRIIWSCPATGTDETRFVGSLTEARKAARKMVGEAIYFDDQQIGTVASAFVADENGNPL